MPVLCVGTGDCAGLVLDMPAPVAKLRRRDLKTCAFRAGIVADLATHDIRRGAARDVTLSQY